jgi:hypothetical protein
MPQQAKGSSDRRGRRIVEIEDEEDVEETELRPVLKPVEAHEMTGICHASSEDDLRRFEDQEEESASSTLPERLIQWAVNVDHERTWFTEKQGSKIPEILDEAARRQGTTRDQWKVLSMLKRPHEMTMYCTARSPEEKLAVIHFRNQAWTGRVNASWQPGALVAEAQRQLKFVGTSRAAKVSTTEEGVLHIEAAEVEEMLEYPVLGRDAEVRIDFEGSVRACQMRNGDGRWEQARHVQNEFKQTLMCSPLEESGDSFVIRTWKPSAFPVRFRKEGTIITSWVDKTHRVVIKEEAQRIFGTEFDIQDTDEPGLFYEVILKRNKPREPAVKKEPNQDIRTRINDHAGIKQSTPPISCADRRAPVPGAGMEQRGESQSVGIGGYTVHLMFPGKDVIKKGITLERGYDKGQLLQRVFKEFKMPPIREECVEIAPGHWNWPDENEATVRFRYDRPKLSTLRNISLEEFRWHYGPMAPVMLETDSACSGNPEPGGWGYVLAQGNVCTRQYRAQVYTTSNKMEGKRSFRESRNHSSQELHI